jgi:outer membrane protein insertion porin family
MSEERATTFIDLENKPYSVNAIRVDGIKHTKATLIESYMTPLLKVNTLGDIITQTQYATHQLKRLGIFRDIDVEFDIADNGRPDRIDINLKFDELPRLTARTGTEIGNNEGSMVILLTS